MINLIVFDPMPRFVEHLKKEGYRYREFKNITPKGDPRIEVHDYEFGSFNGCVGLSATVKEGKEFVPLTDYHSDPK